MTDSSLCDVFEHEKGDMKRHSVKWKLTINVQLLLFADVVDNTAELQPYVMYKSPEFCPVN